MLSSNHLRSFAKASPSPDFTTNSIVVDSSKCIACGLCIKACKTIAGQGVLKLAKAPGEKKKLVSTASGKSLQETNCIKCGQCTLVCPTGAIAEKDQISEVEAVLKNPQGKVTVCQTAPAIRINLSDALGLPPGTISTGKMVTALKQLGFKYVFDTNFSADMTIVEEASELVKRITDPSTGPLPMFTSCCPAWINYVEQSEPELIPQLSSCRSPMGMLSSAIRKDFTQIKNIKPTDIFNVAIMPCTAKKDEIERPQLYTKDGVKETDYVITTRELMRMIKKNKINFKKLPDTPFDTLYAESSLEMKCQISMLKQFVVLMESRLQLSILQEHQFLLQLHKELPTPRNLSRRFVLEKKMLKMLSSLKLWHAQEVASAAVDQHVQRQRKQFKRESMLFIKLMKNLRNTYLTEMLNSMNAMIDS